MPRSTPKRRNLRPAALRPRKRELKRIPSARSNLTPQERKLLADPDWITEDEADAIIGMRNEREGPPTPFEEVLREYGYRLERSAKPRR
jgi:hypothetical protein